ncbi:MAG: carboxypeptidase-like regulatory domain-containing protein [Bacteroidales bacterium]|nr:carboxypeptidase-like regulatory domain-containing protein [Bacteroidales bacterium]
MRFIAFTGFILLLITGLQIRAQNDPLLIDPIIVRLKGRIINAADSSGVPYANIINNRTHSGTITNADGYFSMEILNIDSLEVTSVGFEKKIISIPVTYNEQEVLTFIVNPINYLVGEVEVTGDKPKAAQDLGTGMPTDIPAELRGDAFNEKPPVLAAIFNPISYWQYYLSRREKEKREVREAMMIEKHWEMHSENYNKEVVMKLTGLSEPQADTFMVWFNAQNVLPYTATEYEVRTAIIEYFEIYKKQNR